MKKITNKYIDYISKSYAGLIGLSIARIGIGLATLIILLSCFPIRKDIWTTTYLRVHHIDFGNYFDLFYFLCIIVTVFFILGIESYIFNIIVFVTITILYQSNIYILDGGNNLVSIILFYMLFTKNAQYFSLYKGKISNNKILIAMHNLFYFLIIFQVCTVYFFAGLAKARGNMWIHGTAPYYIFNLDSFSMQPLQFITQLLVKSTFMITLISYLAIFTQLLFPIMLFNKYTKIFAIIGSICFHFSIIIFMGLVPFGITMIALDLSLISDNVYRNLSSSIAKLKLRRNKHA
ncbi:HTTM domain-containing protein [Macrococcus bovicus]|uniref:HTTM domain-containing protein n=1 Tax=Macrococcus bovicus TaxID=69968 RepID=UPI0025A4DE85|nr:HTTM domain-containing protein [Macrococcus bovicus]WJP96770.1 HTTM domain-containing protein [Macrococcus bovicus]